MKITKRHLRRIIKEDREGMTGYVSQIPPGVSLENAEYEQGYNDALKGIPPDLEWEGRSYSDRRDLDSYEMGYESGQEEIANEGLVRISKRQLRRIIKEELFKEVSWYEDQPEEEEAIVNAIRTGSLEVSTIAMVSGLGGPHVRKLLNSLEKRGVVTKKPKPATASRRVPDTWHIKESVLKTVYT